MKNKKLQLLIPFWGLFIVFVYYHGFLANTSTVSNIRLNIYHEENVLRDQEKVLRKEENIVHDLESVDITNTSDNVTFKEKYYMVIVIPSMPSSGEFRHYLRTKWLNQSCWRRDEIEAINPEYLNFKLMFVIGKLPNLQNYSQEFLDELSNNDDMYLIDQVESRKILKDKVIFGMRESIKHFTYNYFIKMDHDTMVDLPRLAKGLPTLPKKNILTGWCYLKLDKGHFKVSVEIREMRYCQGGAYVLSRDVIEKIASLSEEETFIEFGRQEPEDLYTAWLVDQVNKKFTDSVVRVEHHRRLVNGVGIHRYHYWFKRWFNHRIKTVADIERAFACRIKANFTLCPSTNYYYENFNSTECLCKDW